MGGQVSGTLTNSSSQWSTGQFFNAYRFEASPGQAVSIEMRSEQFNTYLWLLNHEGRVITVNDDRRGQTTNGFTSEIIFFPPISGTYFIGASSSDPMEMGEYELILKTTHQPTQEAEGLFETVFGSLEASDFQFSTGQYLDVYTLEGEIGESVTIGLSSSGFDSYLRILDSAGNVLREDDDSGVENDDALIENFVLPESGHYSVWVSSVFAGGTGDYVLSLNEPLRSSRSGLDIRTEESLKLVLSNKGMGEDFADQGGILVRGKGQPFANANRCKGSTDAYTAKVKICIGDREESLSGTVSLSGPSGIVISPGSMSFTVSPNSCVTKSPFSITSASASAGVKSITATVTGLGSDSEDLNVVDVELKKGGTVVNEDDIVYITDTPAMPQLKAKIKPDALSGNADWMLNIEFKRPNRNDDDTLSKTVSAASEWNISQDFGNHFYGGKATLTAKYNGAECKRIFHIRGTNPSENAATTEIGNSPWYAKAIARHESGTQQNRTYLQFNEVGSLGTNYLTNIKHTPNRSSDQKGWGIYQLTKIPPNGRSPSRDEVWGWKANISTGKAVMNSNVNEAPSYFAAIQRKYPAQYEAPPATYTPPGTNTQLTYLEAAALQMFNGSSVVELLPNGQGGNSNYRSCWKFYPNNPSGQKWEFVANQNDYVKKIIEEHENP
ncbi:MAG: PPC domain-containing protein [Pseudomonadota bacterium]